jgi:hypothetical protein
MKYTTIHLYITLFLGLTCGILFGMDKKPVPTNIEDLFTAESPPKMSVEDFDKTIQTKTKHDLSDLYEQLITLAYDTEDEGAIPKMQKIITKIDSLDPEKATVKFHKYNGRLLGYLMKKRTIDNNGKPNTHLLKWITWFLDRGVSPDALDAFGHPPLITAIDQKRTDIITLLIDRGAKQNLEIIEENGYRGTPLYYAEHCLYAKDTERQSIIDALNKKPTIPGILQAVSTTDSQPAPQQTKRSWSFSRSHAVLVTAAAALGIFALYHWIIGKKQTTEHTEEVNKMIEQNVLINTTGKSIWVEHDQDSNFKEIMNDKTEHLGKSLVIRIKATQEQSDKSAMPIKLDGLAEKRKNNYLNITIYKRRWTAWLFGPLGSSIDWVPHTTKKTTE